MVSWVGCQDSAKESSLRHHHLEPLVVVSGRTCQRPLLGVCEDCRAGVCREYYSEVVVESVDVYSAEVLAHLSGFLFNEPRFVYGVVEDGSTAEVWRLRVLADELHVPHQSDVMLLIPEVLSSGESLVGCV